MNNRVRWIAPAALMLVLLTLASRMCHLKIVWVEEAYPAAAAIQMSDHGKTIYQDFWFDKPPGAAYFYRLFDARPGLPLRLAGTFFVLACGLFAGLAARRLWGSDVEGLTAAALLIFSLIFDHPAAVMAIAPDLLMVLPAVVALWFMARGDHALAGVAIGVAFWINPKAAFLGAACLLWSRSPWLVLTALATAGLLLVDVWHGWWEQVVVWGRAYSADPPGSSPWIEGVKQTGSWIWFHLALVTGAGFALWKNGWRRWTWLGMIALSFAAVMLGLRFYPRYFFQLLPVMVLLAARGVWLIPPRYRCVLCAMLLIPAVRFGRQYPVLAMDLIQQRPHPWNQLELGKDSREISALTLARAQRGDTLFVWGYRPDVLLWTRMPLGAPYLDSQPLNGVLADRHLWSAKPSVPARGTSEIKASFVVDGLGLLNPALAFPAGQEYREVGRTRFSILYQRTRIQ